MSIQRLSMVSLPVFNPNNIRRVDPETLRNNVTQSVYELGSTFKPIAIAGAMDAGVVTSMSKRYDATAPLQIGKFKIKDDHPMNRWLNVPETLVHSSNIVTARIADEMGPERMEALFRRIGFYDQPSIELREKGRPLVPGFWARTTTMTTAYGHGIAVTPLQLAVAYAALVNGGILRPATLVKVEPGRAVPGRRVFTQKTSDTSRQLLRLIATDGTGKKADVLGLRVGGKTGTAHKQEGKGYAGKKYRGFFVGMAPIEQPRIIVAVMIDEPSNGRYFGGDVAAPVFSTTVQQTLRLLGIQPDLSVKPQVVAKAVEESF